MPNVKNPKNVRRNQVQTRLTDETLQKVERLAKRKKMTTSSFIEYTLKKAKS